MLRKDSKTDEWKIAGVGVVRPIDARERAEKRSVKCKDNPLLGIFGEAFKMPAVEHRAGEIAGRDTMAQRERLAPVYKALGEKLLEGKTASNMVAALTAAREMKPEVAAAKLRETLPLDLLSVKNALTDAVVSHVARRWKPARDAVSLAIQPDPITDPAMAATGAIRAMEVRNRLAAMTPGDRAKQCRAWGDSGNIDALAACRADPFGLPVPGEILAGAEAAALAAIGGQWLADDHADAVEEVQSLAALADVVYKSVQSELRAAGVPASLLQDSLNATQWVAGQIQ